MLIQDEFGFDIGLIVVSGLFLLCFGIGFNWLVSWLHRRGWDDGYTWLLVVMGTAVTLVVAGFTVGWPVALIVAGYFGCSGLPMAVGDILRHVQARSRESGPSLSTIEELINNMDLFRFLFKIKNNK